MRCTAPSVGPHWRPEPGRTDETVAVLCGGHPTSGLLNGRQIENGLRCVCDPLWVTSLVRSRTGALDVDPLCALFLSGPHGRRAPCHEDCGPAATQQGTSVSEESVCSNCSLLLNCTCTRLSSMKAQSMLFARGSGVPCGHDGLDLRREKGHRPMPLRTQRDPCFARRTEEDGTQDSGREAAARGRSAKRELLQRSWRLRLQRWRLGPRLLPVLPLLLPIAAAALLGTWTRGQAAELP